MPPPKTKRGSQIPLTGAAIRLRFGVPVDPNDPETEYTETREGWSRLQVEKAIDALAKYDPRAHAAINEVFNLDTGGYRDFEHYEQKERAALARFREFRPFVELTCAALSPAMWWAARKMRMPAPLTSHVRRGVWLLVAKLPPSKYPLHVRFPKRDTPETRKRAGAHYESAYRRYQELEADGMKPPAITAAIADEYGCSERRVRQILEIHREKRPPGRPRKKARKK